MKVTFERRADVTDDEGNPGGAWQALPGLCAISAGFRPQFASETLEAGRQESHTKGVLVLRSFEASRGIVGSDRVVFSVGDYAGMTADILSIRRMPDRTIEIALQIGGSDN